MAYERFLDFRARREGRLRRPRAEHGSEEHKLRDLERILTAAIAESSPADTSEFLRITRFFDRERGQSVTDVIPELGEMFSAAPSSLAAAPVLP